MMLHRAVKGEADPLAASHSMEEVPQPMKGMMFLPRGRLAMTQSTWVLVFAFDLNPAVAFVQMVEKHSNTGRGRLPPT